MIEYMIEKAVEEERSSDQDMAHFNNIAVAGHVLLRLRNACPTRSRWRERYVLPVDAIMRSWLTSWLRTRMALRYLEGTPHVPIGRRNVNQFLVQYLSLHQPELVTCNVRHDPVYSVSRVTRIRWWQAITVWSMIRNWVITYSNSGLEPGRIRHHTGYGGDPGSFSPPLVHCTVFQDP